MYVHCNKDLLVELFGGNLSSPLMHLWWGQLLPTIIITECKQKITTLLFLPYIQIFLLEPLPTSSTLTFLHSSLSHSWVNCWNLLTLRSSSFLISHQLKNIFHTEAINSKSFGSDFTIFSNFSEQSQIMCKLLHIHQVLVRTLAWRSKPNVALYVQAIERKLDIDGAALRISVFSRITSWRNTQKIAH